MASELDRQRVAGRPIKVSVDRHPRVVEDIRASLTLSANFAVARKSIVGAVPAAGVGRVASRRAAKTRELSTNKLNKSRCSEMFMRDKFMRRSWKLMEWRIRSVPGRAWVRVLVDRGEDALRETTWFLVSHAQAITPICG